MDNGGERKRRRNDDDKEEEMSENQGASKHVNTALGDLSNTD